ncbi:MAG: protein-tyrosine phosphatase [Myxococcota bacterium]|jgi:protein-tyrosine phosphatase
MTLHRIPVEDYTAPTPPQLSEAVAILQADLAAGERVVVHCMAGRGLAGTAAAAVLIVRGMAPGDAIMLVRWVRPGAIQSADQENRLQGMKSGITDLIVTDASSSAGLKATCQLIKQGAD